MSHNYIKIGTSSPNATGSISPSLSDLSLGTAASSDTTDFLSATGSITLGGDLDVGSSDITSSSNANIELAPNGNGKVTIKGNTGGSGQLVLNCEDNSHGVTLKGPPHSANATYTLTLPNALGSANDVLKTDASGILSWTAQSGGGFDYSAITANTTAQANYHYSCGAGNQSFTLTLPASGVSAGQEVRVKNMGTGTITIARNGNNIDGVASDYSLDVQYSAVTLTADGNDNWEII